MKRSFRVAGILALFLLVIGTAAAQTPTPLIPASTPLEFNQPTEPAALIGSYYNAITLKDYARAYAYWEQAPGGRTEAQFAAGFADTTSAHAIVRLPIFVDAGAGNIYASLPTLVIALRTDGSTAFFTGCFTAHRTNVPVGNATEPDQNWYIREGSLQPATTFNLLALDAACDNAETLYAPANAPLNQSDPVQLLQSYFVGLVNGNPQPAYWQGTTGDVFEAQFGQEAAAATAIRLYINLEIVSEGAAGSIYASIPALTVIEANNTVYHIVGCYTARRSNVPVGNATEPDPNWHFEDAVLSQVLDPAAAISALMQVCALAES